MNFQTEKLFTENKIKYNLPEAEIDYFPEFFALKDQCKFNNCLHKDEPHCAVKAALEKDEIAWSRYKSYTQILEGDEDNYRADMYDAERRASDETRKS